MIGNEPSELRTFLDRRRVKRNEATYEGAGAISLAEAGELVAATIELKQTVQRWLAPPSGAILQAMHAGRPIDTSPEAWDKQFELYHQMTPAQKADGVRALTLAANTVALAGLRSRYPAASESELRLRLAALRLGEEVVARAYNWSPPPRGA